MYIIKDSPFNLRVRNIRQARLILEALLTKISVI